MCIRDSSRSSPKTIGPFLKMKLPVWTVWHRSKAVWPASYYCPECYFTFLLQQLSSPVGRKLYLDVIVRQRIDPSTPSLVAICRTHRSAKQLNMFNCIGLIFYKTHYIIPLHTMLPLILHITLHNRFPSNTNHFFAVLSRRRHQT